MGPIIILGVESSCDDTALALVQDTPDGWRVLARELSSQADIHKKYGGVVPEIASRQHAELINALLERLFGQAQLGWGEVELIAVTNGPGLIGSLLIGVGAAKAIAFAREIPIIGVHHLKGHIYSVFIERPSLAMPFVALVVSGGHTVLVNARGHGDFVEMGRTRDDAAGEAFDKVAKALGLGYPGGPLIDQLAKVGNPGAIPFPRALPAKDSLEFSFSGLKTAVMYFLKQQARDQSAFSLSDLAASFQEAVVDALAEKTVRAAGLAGVKQIVLVGGVACNSRLREKMTQRAAEAGMDVYYPSPELCTDNAEMIACAGYHEFKLGRRDTLRLDVHPSLAI
ncbi:MAG: tRNA (adenosine(37)-N6)-threonylcarbamoyltransferase complex transferase subunit TsaD [Armatimonadetes bacterium]|nr:tRNA (adenosine(37)-N6)-threonylcarbamoyltransferase complex transferase subunit TsaD [Armatimonadota bacterium]